LPKEAQSYSKTSHYRKYSPIYSTPKKELAQKSCWISTQKPGVHFLMFACHCDQLIERYNWLLIHCYFSPGKKFKHAWQRQFIFWEPCCLQETFSHFVLKLIKSCHSLDFQNFAFL